MVCPWFVYGLSVVCLWFVYGLSVVCLWFVYGLSGVVYGLNLGLLELGITIYRYYCTKPDWNIFSFEKQVAFLDPSYPAP